MQQILPPEHPSPVPDEATKLGLPDHTNGGSAGGRVLHVNLGFVKFGTDDKTQAIALILTVLLIVLLVVLLIFGPANDQTKSLMDAFKNVLLLTVGVAVGTHGSNSKSHGS